jgi:hypothetical protein
MEQPPSSVRYISLRAGDNVRYVVPHRLNPESLASGAQRLQMRVTQPIEAATWVQVLDGDDLIARKAERYVRPGEMVTVEVPRSAYDHLQETTELTVRVVRR